MSVRVNAMLKYLYSQETVPNEGDLDIDRQLVEQEFESAMNYYYKEFYKEPCFSYCEKVKSSVILKSNSDGTLTIKLADHLRSYAATPLSLAYDKLHKDHKETLDERDQLKVELADKAQVIASKESDIARQAQVIASRESDIAGQAQVIASRESDIARQQVMIAKLMAMMKELQDRPTQPSEAHSSVQHHHAFFSSSVLPECLTKASNIPSQKPQ